MAVRLDKPYCIAWKPQVGPQTALLRCPVFEVFYGGARGGGKTDGMLGDFAAHAGRYGKYARGVFFRRRAKNLEEVIRRSEEIYSRLGARYVGGQKTQWTFPNGATLKFRHLWDGAAAEDYQGHSYTRLYFEELTQWPDPEPIDKLRATLRSADGVPVGFRSTGNPGGAGHNWVKARYIDPSPLGYKILKDRRTGQEYTFIPARLEDNLVLINQDPGYEFRLLASGSDDLVKAWRWGLWDIVAGGFFDDVWDASRQVLKPFRIPPGWRYRRSFDWGSAKPSSLGVWAISDGNPIPEGPYQGRVFPRGSTIRIGEWYTCKEEAGLLKPNRGLRYTNKQLGKGIAQISKNYKFSSCVADPAIFTKHGTKSIYQQMQKGALLEGHELYFHRANNSRIAGWQLMRIMLKESLKKRPENPGLWVFDTCTHFLRTVPVLQRDLKNEDDIDTNAEDHVADETRYLLMSLGMDCQSEELI